MTASNTQIKNLLNIKQSGQLFEFRFSIYNISKIRNGTLGTRFPKIKKAGSVPVKTKKNKFFNI